METYRDKLGKAHALFEQVKAILANAEATAEEKAKVSAMVADAKALQHEAKALKEILDSGIEQQMAEMKQREELVTGRSGGADSSGWGGVGVEAWREYLYETWKAGNPKLLLPPDPRLKFFKDELPAGMQRKDMAEGSGAGGGYLVPAEFQTQLRAIMGEQGLIRGRATVIRMGRRELQIPVLDQTGTTAGIPHWFGGLRFYWAEEAEQKTESDPAFRQVKLVAHKLIGYTRASDELVDDSALSLADFLAGPMGFAGGAVWMEDYAFLRGNGAGQPLGIINAGATIQVARAAVGAIGFVDLANMLEHFLPSGKGIWLCTQSALADLIQMSGPAANASYLWLNGPFNGGATGGVNGTLLGMPIRFSEKNPLIGAVGDIVLADLSYYLIGDRQATTVESTKFDRWQYDQTSWRMVHRVDGQPWLSAPLTYQDGETQVSPFVELSGSAIT